MSESVIERTAIPATRSSIRDSLEALGLASGSTVLVHPSLSRLGWVAGGAHAVVLALIEAVGADGTLVMPTHSGDLSDPARWQNPPIPETWWDLVRTEMPAFDPSLTPTAGMGAIVECFRRAPEVLRSSHPTYSFAALGPGADDVIRNHELANGLGEGSPLARLYDMDAWVLLLGVDHDNNTSLHLAENRADYPQKAWITQASPVIVGGLRRWIEYPEVDLDESDFQALGVDFAGSGNQTKGTVGTGTAKLMRQRVLVDFAVSWFEQHRVS